MEKNTISINTELLSSNLKKAREASGKSIKEISALLKIPASRLKNYEKGKYIPAMPELESISYIYRIPLFALLGEWDINHFIHAPDQEQLQHLIEIRQEIISTRLLLAREEMDMSYKDLSVKTGITTGKIKRYESGDAPPPLDELINLCEALDISIHDLIDKESPVGSWQEYQSIYQALKSMPPELVNFFNQDKNIAYLNLAMQFSKIGIEKFTQLANSMSEFVNGFTSTDHANQS